MPIYKVKYYLIKAHLKIRTKDASAIPNLNELTFPQTLLDETDEVETTNIDDVSFLMNKMLNWIDKNLNGTTTAKPSSQSITSPLKSSSQQQQQQDDVQELEEEQEVQEVEMFGEADSYDPVNLINSVKEENEAKWTSCATEDTASSPIDLNMDELLRLTTSASFFYNQQRLNACASMGSNGVSLILDNHFLVHLLAINKNENVFRVKQIHDYYGGCFICGKQVDFNMKHYQVRWE
jgi:hypothetical protein